MQEKRTCLNKCPSVEGKKEKVSLTQWSAKFSNKVFLQNAALCNRFVHSEHCRERRPRLSAAQSLQIAALRIYFNRYKPTFLTFFSCNSCHFWNSPGLQIPPFLMYPSLQRHSKSPGTFTHCSFSAHGFWVHSSTSEKYVCYTASISETWQEILILNHKLNKWHCILACSHPLSYPFLLDNNGQKGIDHVGWTRELCILNKFSNPILASTSTHPREMGSNLLQPKGDWLYLSFQYLSLCSVLKPSYNSGKMALQS